MQEGDDEKDLNCGSCGRNRSSFNSRHGFRVHQGLCKGNVGSSGNGGNISNGEIEGVKEVEEAGEKCLICPICGVRQDSFETPGHGKNQSEALFRIHVGCCRMKNIQERQKRGKRKVLPSSTSYLPPYIPSLEDNDNGNFDDDFSQQDKYQGNGEKHQGNNDVKQALINAQRALSLTKSTSSSSSSSTQPFTHISTHTSTNLTTSTSTRIGLVVEVAEAFRRNRVCDICRARPEFEPPTGPGPDLSGPDSTEAVVECASCPCLFHKRCLPIESFDRDAYRDNKPDGSHRLLEITAIGQDENVVKRESTMERSTTTSVGESGNGDQDYHCQRCR